MQIVLAGRALKPTPEQQREFGPRCKQLFRMYRFAYSSKRMPVYLHTLAAHGESPPGMPSQRGIVRNLQSAWHTCNHQLSCVQGGSTWRRLGPWGSL